MTQLSREGLTSLFRLFLLRAIYKGYYIMKLWLTKIKHLAPKKRVIENSLLAC
jgi:hypothetical protein